MFLVLPGEVKGLAGVDTSRSSASGCAADIADGALDLLNVETRTAEDGWDPSDKVEHRHLCQQLNLVRKLKQRSGGQRPGRDSPQYNWGSVTGTQAHAAGNKQEELGMCV